ncbi:MAG: hypothetical protein CMF12_00685 [Idiomarina sp.]|uniref:SAVED domain-containing protein n=1 Tax=Idiomarina sp. TaxID=1874361 RepID=UPI000C5904C2|nr:SAVED domain-containing protein [Idiomarina sp.]MBT41018.1 hypothetical protein [Idiomarina sp.]
MSKNVLSIHQAQHDPIESLEKLDEFINTIGALPNWNEAGVLTDESAHNQLVVLLSDNLYVSVRLNLVFEEVEPALNRLGIANEVNLRHKQGRRLKREDLASMESVLAVWNECQTQSMNIEIKSFLDFLRALWGQRQLTGRGKPFSKGTLEKLARNSHGYCMFEGCGENLNVEKLTGYTGNFAYNAHIIASSESGPRGVPYLSDYHSDNPENVLVLCDKHHRLIDKVAAVDFDAARLSYMRSNFTHTVKSLLEGLSFRPIPAFSVLWPVGGHIVSEPDERDIANSMSRIRARPTGRLNRLSHNDRRYRKSIDVFERELAEIVKEEAEYIIQQTQNESHKAALFAFGPMPALVGLGASLGNKCEITPMLRFRDGGYWMWPQESEVPKPYSIEFDEDELEGKDEVTICIATTQYPDSMRQSAENIGMPIIEIKAVEYGNAAIPHPENGKQLRSDLHTLLLKLYDQFSIKKVNLLICASNAVCVFVGQAFDLHQPSLLVYDFGGKFMKPRLQIDYQERKLTLTLSN